LENGGFSFRKSQYALYFINFALDPLMWGESGQTMQFETQFFCAYNKANIDFDIQVNMVSSGVKTVELISGVKGESEAISSGKIPVDSLGTSISIRIPSP